MLNEASRRFFLSRSLLCECGGLRSERSQRSTQLTLSTRYTPPNFSISPKSNCHSLVPTERKASWPRSPNNQSRITPVPISLFQFPFSALPRHRKLRHNPRLHFNPFRKRRQRNPLIIPVHPLQILRRQRKRPQSIRLHVMQSQLRRIRRPRRL